MNEHAAAASDDVELILSVGRLLVRMHRQRQLCVQRPALEETDGMRSRRPRDSGFGVGQTNEAAAIDLIHARAVRWMCYIPTCTTSGGGAEASHALNSDREGRTRGECDFRKEMEAEDAEKRISASWVAELRHRLHVAAIRHELSGDDVDVERQRLVAWGRELDVVPARHQIERRADAV